MTRLHAKRYVCASLAALLRGALENGDGWLGENVEESNASDAVNEANIRRVQDAVRDLIDEMARRGREVAR